MKYVISLVTSLLCSIVFAVSTVYAEGRILFIDSYHEGYAWSDGITKGITSVLAETDVQLEIIRMDTKRNAKKAFIQQKATDVKAAIESFGPDVVIAADDNASKYVIKPFYKNAELPVIFCGINWDASVYGYPYSNATGMVEVALVAELLEYLKPYAKGENVAYLAADVLTARKEGRYYRSLFNVDLDERYVKKFDRWAETYAKLQKNSDILLVGNIEGINDWDEARAEELIETGTTIPSGTLYDFMAKYALIGYAKVAEEQGQWAAETALKVLRGADVSTIPIARNNHGSLILNMKLAENMNIVFPETLIQKADLVIR